jgi:hypothetical protein
LLGLPIVNNSRIAGVTIVPQDQALQPELHFIGIPQLQPVLTFARRTHFVVYRLHRRDVAIPAQRRLNEIHLRYHAEPLRTEHHRARMNLVSLGHRLHLISLTRRLGGLGQCTLALVHPRMHRRPLHCVRDFHEDPFDVLVVEQTRTIPAAGVKFVGRLAAAIVTVLLPAVVVPVAVDCGATNVVWLVPAVPAAASGPKT